MVGYKRERNKHGQVEKGCGRWELVVNVPSDPATGKRRQVSRIFYGGSRAADNKLAELVAEVLAGRHGDSETLLSTSIKAWLDEVGDDLSPTTLREYRRLAEKRVGPVVGKLPLRKVTAGELTAFYAALRKGGLKPQTIRNVHTVISGGLGHAVRNEWMATNPARDAKRPKGPSRRRPPPTEDEVKRLIAGCTEDRRRPNPELASIVRLGIACGGRRGELIGLRRTRVNLEAGTITIKRAIAADGRKLVEKSTKTHQERTVELGPRAVKALRDHLERMDKRAANAGVRIAKNAFVFSDAMNCSTPWRPNRVTLAFGRLSRRVLTERPKNKRVRFHDLRHARATWMIDEGIPLPKVADTLGHSAMETTARLYVHGTTTHDERAAGIGDDVQ